MVVRLALMIRLRFMVSAVEGFILSLSKDLGDSRILARRPPGFLAS